MFILETSIKCQFSTIKISQLTKTSRSLVCDLNKSRFSDLVFQGPNVNFRKVDLHRYWTEKWHLGVFVLFCFNFSTGTRCFKFKSPIQERWVCICTQLMTFWLTFFTLLRYACAKRLRDIHMNEVAVYVSCSFSTILDIETMACWSTEKRYVNFFVVSRTCNSARTKNELQFYL